MITLVLHGIGFEARHGATAAERRHARRFEVDVEIDAAIDRAGRTDRVADTVDYRRIAEAIVEAGTAGAPSRLLETVAARMMTALLDIVAPLDGNAVVRIELRKPAPPGCAGDPRVAAVRLSASPSQARRAT